MRKIGPFQYFTFREYLAYVSASYNVPLPDVAGLVKGFHFEYYTDVLLRELSTGNLKKAYLITAFALRPRLLLLDEPVNGLDFQSTEFLYQLMGGYKQYGTLLFSSHILESICLTSDRVLVFRARQDQPDIRRYKDRCRKYPGGCWPMKNTIKALSKQFFGAKYESAGKVCWRQ